MDTAGFYKFDNGNLLFGTHVSGPEFDLSPQGKADYQYPIDGWYWFDRIEDARVFFNVSDTNPDAANRQSTRRFRSLTTDINT